MRLLKKMMNQNEDWDVLSDEVTFFYNTTPKKTFKGISPFEFLYGFAPRFLNQKMRTTREGILTDEAFEKYITTRQDLFLRTPELVQDVIAENPIIADKINEDQDRLPS